MSLSSRSGSSSSSSSSSSDSKKEKPLLVHSSTDPAAIHRIISDWLSDSIQVQGLNWAKEEKLTEEVLSGIRNNPNITSVHFECCNFSSKSYLNIQLNDMLGRAPHVVSLSIIRPLTEGSVNALNSPYLRNIYVELYDSNHLDILGVLGPRLNLNTLSLKINSDLNIDINKILQKHSQQVFEKLLKRSLPNTINTLSMEVDYYHCNLEARRKYYVALLSKGRDIRMCAPSNSNMMDGFSKLCQDLTRAKVRNLTLTGDLPVIFRSYLERDQLKNPWPNLEKLRLSPSRPCSPNLNSAFLDKFINEHRQLKVVEIEENTLEESSSLIPAGFQSSSLYLISTFREAKENVIYMNERKCRDLFHPTFSDTDMVRKLPPVLCLMICDYYISPEMVRLLLFPTINISSAQPPSKPKMISVENESKILSKDEFIVKMKNIKFDFRDQPTMTVLNNIDRVMNLSEKYLLGCAQDNLSILGSLNAIRERITSLKSTALESKGDVVTLQGIISQLGQFIQEQVKTTVTRGMGKGGREVMNYLVVIQNNLTRHFPSNLADECRNIIVSSSFSP